MDTIWSRRAIRAIENIADYIALDDPQAAYNVTETIRHSVLSLADFPQMGRTGRIAGTRELVIAGLPYFIPYRVRGNRVEILDVIHTSRRFPPVP